MKDETGASRSSFSRIDIGRSLSIGKPTRTSSTTPPATTETATPAPTSTDAAKVSLTSLFEGIANAPQEGQIPAATASTVAPEEASPPVANSREAAKASYLRQGSSGQANSGLTGQVSRPISTEASTIPTERPSAKVNESRDIVVDDGEVLSDMLAKIQLKLNEYEVSEADDTPAGDPPETLKPLAEKYVGFLEQTGQQFSTSERASKIEEVVTFYSAPTRQGRLQALVQDI